MSEGKVLVSGGEASESGKDILKELPPWMPRTESTGNFKLIDGVGRSFDRLSDDIQDANDASNVQTAKTVEQIEKLAGLVNVLKKSNESVEKYRLRVIAGFQNITNEGDLPGLIDNIGILLNINTDEIGYLDTTQNATFVLTVPKKAVDTATLTDSEFADIINDQVAAGFFPQIQIRGTFSYITSDEYKNSSHDSTNGYDGLGSDGNQKNNGGTYAGVLN